MPLATSFGLNSEAWELKSADQSPAVFLKTGKHATHIGKTLCLHSRVLFVPHLSPAHSTVLTPRHQGQKHAPSSLS